MELPRSSESKQFMTTAFPKIGMKHVVNYSGGLCSFWAAHRVIKKFGTMSVVLLFADTLVEDEDLYAFNQQSAQLLGVQITRVSRELTPWQLFRKEGIIGNSKYPICSVYLKREVLDEWHALYCLDLAEEQQGELIPSGKQPCTIYLGFEAQHPQ